MKKQAFLIISELWFGLFLLSLIALTSSIGSFIEQDQPKSFYLENYAKPIYGIIDSSFVLGLGLDHIYTTGWFLGLLVFFGISLISCTIRRQFPLFFTSKEFFFKTKKNSFVFLPFSIKLPNFFFFNEIIGTKIQNLDFYLYQKQNLLYGYKGLIGRISPILVHFSLLLILIGATGGAFFQLKIQEKVPKGDLFHLQNPIRIGWLSTLPTIHTRVNDFWVEYENNRIHQFYTNFSVLNETGKEIKQQTISVNHPFRWNQFDFYQSDWNLIGIRIQNCQTNQIYELPFFELKKGGKSGIGWIKENNQIKNLAIDQFQNTILVYEKKGNFLGEKNLGEKFSESSNFRSIELLPSTGLLIKSDPSIPLIYLGFGFLMGTACLSYFPYNQIWICQKENENWIGSATNRGKIQLEIEFENFIRGLESQISKTLQMKTRK